MRNLKSVLGLALLFVVVAAPTCNTRSFKMGIAGITPAGWPNPTEDAWQRFYQDVRSSADHLGVHVEWPDLTPVLAANGQGVPVSLVMGISLVSDDILELVKFTVAALVNNANIPYFCVGNEIENSPNFPALANRINVLLATVKSQNPMIKTCTVFQYERSLGISDQMAEKIGMIEADLIAFTSYPILAGHTKVKSVPGKYYRNISRWTSKPIAFTEVGWPSESYPTWSGSPAIAGSPKEQVEFLKKFGSIAPRNTVFVNWLFLNDPSTWKSGDPYTRFDQVFESMGLRENDGTAKPALETWLKAFSTPYQPPKS